MKTIIIDYEIGGQPYRTKLRVTVDVFNSVAGISWGDYHFADTIETHRLRAYLRQMTWLDGTNRQCRPITITKILEVK